MGTQFEIVNPLEYPYWNDLVIASGDYSFFHSSNWARVLHESYGYRPDYFAMIKDGSLRALIPVMEVRSMFTGLRGVSLPFTDYCNPIAAADVNPDDALNCLIDYGRKAGWEYIALRGMKHFAEDMPYCASFYNHVLPLSEDEKSITSGFKNHIIKNIRKASNLGLVANIHTTLDAVNEFYRLHCMTRKLHGVPPQPFSFFRKIHEHVIAKGHGFVILAPYEGEHIAGGIFFHFGDLVIFKYSASNRKYQSLRPNNILIWTAISRYAKEGYKSMSFGRTDMNAEGLRDFKKSWGAREEIIKYYKYNLGKDGLVTYGPQSNEVFGKIFEKMPIPLLKIAGSLVYRHVG